MHDIRRWTAVLAITIGFIAIPVSRTAAQNGEARIAGTTGSRYPMIASSKIIDDSEAHPFWEVLGDTTLDRLMGEALRGNLDLRAAAARVGAADASHLQAALEFTPSINASAGYTRRRLASSTYPGLGAGVLPDQDLWDSGLSGSLEIDVFGRLRGNLRAQGELLDAADEDLRDAEVDVVAALLAAYLDLRGTQNQLAVARRNADNQKHTLELTRSRLEAGRGTELDTERARAQLSTTLAAIPSLEARIAALQHRIAVLSGHPPSELTVRLAEPSDLPELPDAVPMPGPEDVITRRPDVLGAENRVAASRAMVRSARAEYLPRLSLAGTAGYTANAVDAFGNRGTFNYAFGPVLSWAAFDLGRVRARVDQAHAEELQARARYEQIVLLAREQVETASVVYRTAAARLQLLREAAASSERAAALARLRYEGGIADFLQVLDAERTLLTAQDQLAQGITQAFDAWVALYRSRGLGWPADTERSR